MCLLFRYLVSGIFALSSMRMTSIKRSSSAFSILKAQPISGTHVCDPISLVDSNRRSFLRICRVAESKNKLLQKMNIFLKFNLVAFYKIRALLGLICKLCFYTFKLWLREKWTSITFSIISNPLTKAESEWSSSSNDNFLWTPCKTWHIIYLLKRSQHNFPAPGSFNYAKQSIIPSWIIRNSPQTIQLWNGKCELNNYIATAPAGGVLTTSLKNCTYFYSSAHRHTHKKSNKKKCGIKI